VAASKTKQEALHKLGINQDLDLKAAEEGLLKGPGDVDMIFPLAFDELIQKECYVAPLGGTYYGYKGFGLNMLIEMDNVIGGGVPELIRVLSEKGTPLTTERVSQTIEAYALDVWAPLAEIKKRLQVSVETTLRCGNHLLFLPGQKEQENRKKILAEGIPMISDRISVLENVAEHPKVGLRFNLSPIKSR
jgi:LDH2 family malate/lactate/ureidoglycolate dehydrogenase